MLPKIKRTLSKPYSSLNITVARPVTTSLQRLVVKIPNLVSFQCPPVPVSNAVQRYLFKMLFNVTCLKCCSTSCTCFKCCSTSWNCFKCSLNSTSSCNFLTSTQSDTRTELDSLDVTQESAMTFCSIGLCQKSIVVKIWFSSKKRIKIYIQDLMVIKIFIKNLESYSRLRLPHILTITQIKKIKIIFFI